MSDPSKTGAKDVKKISQEKYFQERNVPYTATKVTAEDIHNGCLTLENFDMFYMLGYHEEPEGCASLRSLKATLHGLASLCITLRILALMLIRSALLWSALFCFLLCFVLHCFALHCIALHCFALILSCFA